MALLSAFVILAVVGAGGVFMVTVALQPPPPSSAEVLDRRLDLYEGTTAPTLEAIELEQPFAERVLMPLVRRVAGALSRSAPQKQLEETQRRLVFAGRPFGLSAPEFLAVRYVALVVVAALGLGLGLLTHNPLLAVVLLAVGGVAGLFLPGFLLSRRVSRRREEMQAALPDATDLLIVSIEAGLTFEAALARVAQKGRDALAQEFARVLQETRLGRSHLEALVDMADRCGVEEIHNFVQAVVQSHQLGAGVVRVLRAQAEDTRRRRLQRAQEKGAQASVKMLLPMVGCIFPTLWIVLLGPALLLLLHALSRR